MTRNDYDALAYTVFHSGLSYSVAQIVWTQIELKFKNKLVDDDVQAAYDQGYEDGQDAYECCRG
jgi:hypothetical protein